MKGIGNFGVIIRVVWERAMLQDRTYLNPELPVEERIEILLSQMTLTDKIGQMNQV